MSLFIDANTTKAKVKFEAGFPWMECALLGHKEGKRCASRKPVEENKEKKMPKIQCNDVKWALTIKHPNSKKTTLFIQKAEPNGEK